MGGVLVALVAARIARRPANTAYSFGHRLAEVIGALVDGALLLGMAALVIVMGAMRLGQPVAFPTAPMPWVVAAGLVTEGVSLVLLWRQQKTDLNVRGAYWQILQTFVGSLIIVATVVIRFTGSLAIDPLLGMAFGLDLVLLRAGWSILRESLCILMDATPPGMDLPAVVAKLGQIDGVREVYHAHAWRLSDGCDLFTASRRILFRSGERAGPTCSTRRIVSSRRPASGSRRCRSRNAMPRRTRRWSWMSFRTAAPEAVGTFQRWTCVRCSIEGRAPRLGTCVTEDTMADEPMHSTDAETHGTSEKSGPNWKMYANLLAMVTTSTVVMYFFMYWNIYRWTDFWLSETRAYMSMLMFGTMLAIMLSFMIFMYKTRWLNLTLYGLSLALFALGLWLVRSQITVQDESWMKSMIPHHSIAIMVSERATITDPRARRLADEIIAAQEKEIAEMEYLIRQIRENGEVGDDYPIGAPEGPTPVAASVAEALSRPALAGVDVGGMTDEEVAQVVPDAVCAFRFSEGQQTLVAVNTAGEGVMKITGQLVPVALAEGELSTSPVLAAEGVRLAVVPQEGGEGSDLIFDLQTEPALRVGYGGVYICT